MEHMEHDVDEDGRGCHLCEQIITEDSAHAECNVGQGNAKCAACLACPERQFHAEPITGTLARRHIAPVGSASQAVAPSFNIIDMEAAELKLRTEDEDDVRWTCTKCGTSNVDTPRFDGHAEWATVKCKGSVNHSECKEKMDICRYCSDVGESWQASLAGKVCKKIQVHLKGPKAWEARAQKHGKLPWHTFHRLVRFIRSTDSHEKRTQLQHQLTEEKKNLCRVIANFQTSPQDDWKKVHTEIQRQIESAYRKGYEYGHEYDEVAQGFLDPEGNQQEGPGAMQPASVHACGEIGDAGSGRVEADDGGMTQCMRGAGDAGEIKEPAQRLLVCSLRQPV